MTVRFWPVRLAVVLLVSAGSGSWASPEVEVIRRHVKHLASDELGGRMTGSEGARAAADYIAQALEALDAKPLPGREDFLLPFEFTAGTKDAGTTLTLAATTGVEPTVWKGEEQVRALSFTDDADVSGAVVFAGYGIVVPEGQEPAYDSYAGLDVAGKIVLLLRYQPEDTDEETRSGLAPYAGLRYKAMSARERGAAGVLVVAGPRSPRAGQTIEMSFDAAVSGSGIAAASISGPVAERLFALGGKRELAAIQAELDTGNPHVTGFELPGVRLTLSTRVERERRTAYNVGGVLPAKGTTAAAGTATPSYVLLGAHYDHLGDGSTGNSLAKKGEVGQIHNGADDNASGVAAILLAASRIDAFPEHGPLLLMFWSGEELGLLGSNDFVKNGPIPIDRIRAHFNLDMVGRLRENRVNLQGVGSSAQWPRLIEQANVPIGLDVRTQSDPYLPTDYTSLYKAGVPGINFFTGSHDDYHRPTDDVSRVNFSGVERIAALVVTLFRAVDRLERPLDYVKVEPTTRAGGDRDSLRAYTGTIPDYGTEVEGLLLSGVVGGGPAEKAGLREGDVIVEFGGRKIANVYDYTYALAAAKIDQPVKVQVLRDGERLELTLTPTARP